MIRFTHRAGYVLGLCAACAAGGLRTDVSMPSIFSDNMMLQQGKPVPVHGTAAPSEQYDAVQEQIYEAAAHKDPGIKPECLAWATPEYDASAWKNVAVPGSIESRGMNIDGAVWFRAEVELPATWAGKDAQLYLGPITHRVVDLCNIGPARSWLTRFVSSSA